MPRRVFSFSQLDFKRALRAAEEAGKSVSRVEFALNGNFTLLFGEPEAPPANGHTAESSEANLDRELADWEAKRGDRTVSP